MSTGVATGSCGGRHRVCVAQPTVERAAERVLHGVANVTESMNARSLNQAALSGLYNVAYYCGMAQAFGGPGAFYESIVRAPDENLPAWDPSCALRSRGAGRSCPSCSLRSCCWRVAATRLSCPGLATAGVAAASSVSPGVTQFTASGQDA